MANFRKIPKTLFPYIKKFVSKYHGKIISRNEYIIYSSHYRDNYYIWYDGTKIHLSHISDLNSFTVSKFKKIVKELESKTIIVTK